MVKFSQSYLLFPKTKNLIFQKIYMTELRLFIKSKIINNAYYIFPLNNDFKIVYLRQNSYFITFFFCVDGLHIIYQYVLYCIL